MARLQTYDIITNNCRLSESGSSVLDFSTSAFNEVKDQPKSNTLARTRVLIASKVKGVTQLCARYVPVNYISVERNVNQSSARRSEEIPNYPDILLFDGDINFTTNVGQNNIKDWLPLDIENIDITAHRTFPVLTVEETTFDEPKLNGIKSDYIPRQVGDYVKDMSHGYVFGKRFNNAFSRDKRMGVYPRPIIPLVLYFNQRLNTHVVINRILITWKGNVHAFSVGGDYSISLPGIDLINIEDPLAFGKPTIKEVEYIPEDDTRSIAIANVLEYNVSRTYYVIPITNGLDGGEIALYFTAPLSLAPTLSEFYAYSILVGNANRNLKENMKKVRLTRDVLSVWCRDADVEFVEDKSILPSVGARNVLVDTDNINEEPTQKETQELYTEDESDLERLMARSRALRGKAVRGQGFQGSHVYVEEHINPAIPTVQTDSGNAIHWLDMI